MAWCLLNSKNVLGEFWGEAVNTAAYLLHRAPTRSLETGGRRTRPGTTGRLRYGTCGCSGASLMSSCARRPQREQVVRQVDAQGVRRL
jgi:hypothetical protein